MPPSQLDILKRIFTHEYWLVGCLAATFFVFFGLDRGGIVVFIQAGFFFLLLNVLTGQYRLRTIPARFWVTAGIFAYLMLASIVFHPHISHYRWMKFALRMLGMVFMIHCVGQKTLAHWVKTALLILFSLALGWQFAARYIFSMPLGTFSNPHKISLFAMLALPFIVYLIWALPGWYKYIFVALGLFDIDLLVRIGSRPAILALAAAGLGGLIFLVKDRRKWIGVVAIGVFFLALHFTRYAGLDLRFRELFAHLASEERITMWSATWQMLKTNSIPDWIVGHGIGSFRTVFPQFAPPPYGQYVFPHFQLLELLYQSGLIGVGLVCGGLISLFVIGIGSLKNVADKKRAVLIKCLLIIFISWLMFCGSTLPIYSRYSQYSLAFILGPLLSIVPAPEEPPSFQASG